MAQTIIPLGDGLSFLRARLGQPIFIKNEGLENRYMEPGMNAISPRDWTPEQLRTMATWIENHPECLLFDDGGGADLQQYRKSVRLTKLRRLLR